MTFTIEGVGGHLMLAHVDNSVDVEGDLLGVGSPGLVTKAVNVFSIVLGCERVVAVGDTLLVCLVLTSRVGDLSKLASCLDTQQYLLRTHTQKSISRLPALPNSRSPTWKVTVIVSSLWRDS